MRSPFPTKHHVIRSARMLRTCPDEEARLVSDRAPLKVREDDLGIWLPMVRSDGQRFACAFWMCANTSNKASTRSGLLE